MTMPKVDGQALNQPLNTPMASSNKKLRMKATDLTSKELPKSSQNIDQDYQDYRKGLNQKYGTLLDNSVSYLLDNEIISKKDVRAIKQLPPNQIKKLLKSPAESKLNRLRHAPTSGSREHIRRAVLTCYAKTKDMGKALDLQERLTKQYTAPTVDGKNRKGSMMGWELLKEQSAFNLPCDDDRSAAARYNPDKLKQSLDELDTMSKLQSINSHGAGSYMRIRSALDDESKQFLKVYKREDKLKNILEVRAGGPMRQGIKDSKDRANVRNALLLSLAKTKNTDLIEKAKPHMEKAVQDNTTGSADCYNDVTTKDDDELVNHLSHFIRPQEDDEQLAEQHQTPGGGADMKELEEDDDENVPENIPAFQDMKARLPPYVRKQEFGRYNPFFVNTADKQSRDDFAGPPKQVTGVNWLWAANEKNEITIGAEIDNAESGRNLMKAYGIDAYYLSDSDIEKMAMMGHPSVTGPGNEDQNLDFERQKGTGDIKLKKELQQYIRPKWEIKNDELRNNYAKGKYGGELQYDKDHKKWYVNSESGRFAKDAQQIKGKVDGEARLKQVSRHLTKIFGQQVGYKPYGGKVTFE